MTEAIKEANKRLWRLEVTWIVLMSFGTLVAIEFGIVTDSHEQVSTSSLKSILLFLSLGLIATPLSILLLLPCWNFISPIQDRATIWETEFVVLIVTFILMTFLSVYFFGMPQGAAIKTQLFMTTMLSPILCLSAQYRFYVYETEARQQLLEPVVAIHSRFEQEIEPS